MRSRSRPLLAAALASALLLAACSTDTATDGSASDGSATDPAGDTNDNPLEFTATALDGKTVDGSSLEGVDTVLWFWAPWCSICRAEAPEVLDTAADFEGSVEFVGVAGRGEPDAMEDFVSDTGTGSLRHIVDADGSIWTGFGIIGQPSFAFVNDDGTTEVFGGGLPKDALVERINDLIAA